MRKEVWFSLKSEMLLFYLDQWKVKRGLYKHMISMLFRDALSIGVAVLDSSSPKKWFFKKVIQELIRQLIQISSFGKMLVLIGAINAAMFLNSLALYYFSWLLAIGDTIMDILSKKTCKAIRRAIAQENLFTILTKHGLTVNYLISISKD